MEAGSDTLEREEELDALAAALDSAANGAGRTLIIEGPAGIGKTRLVEDVRSLAKARGFGRLRAVGDDLERSMPWAVVRQMVERSITRYPPDIRERILAGPAGAALATLGDAPAEGAEIAHTLHALWWVAIDLSATRPLLITVDDAQWSDLPSLRFLIYLSRRIADLPIALVVATRPPTESTGALAELCGGGAVDRLLPSPLSRDAVAALAGEAPATAVVDALLVAGGGNPFLTGRVLDELALRQIPLDDPRTAEVIGGLGPAAVSRALLSRLPPDAVALAEATAVLGARGAPAVAAAMLGFDDGRVAVARDTLVTGHVLAETTDVLAFVHPVVREAVLAQLGRGERTLLHARAAQELQAAGSSDERVAAHLSHAPPNTLPGGAALLRRTAARMLTIGDAETAVACLRRVLEELPQDDDVRAELGLALLRAGDAAAAHEHLQEAAAATEDRRAQAERLAAAASARAVTEGSGAAITELLATLADWPDATDEPARLVLEARLAFLRVFVAEESYRSAAYLATFADLPGATPQERSLLAMLAYRYRYDVRPATEAADVAARALGNGAFLEDATDGLVEWSLAVTVAIASDATDVGSAEVSLARARLRRRGSPLDFALISMGAGLLAWRIGDVAGTEAEFQAAVTAIEPEAPSVPVHAVAATAARFLVLVALERGDRAAATAALARYDAWSWFGPQLVSAIGMGEPRALVALAHDDPETAHREAAAVGRRLRETRTDTPTVAWRVPLAIAAARLGREDEARTLATEHLALARQWGTATDVGAALRLRARVDGEGRLETLEEAVATLERSPSRLELARALVDLGEAMRVARRRKDAHAPLERGAELATACRAPVLRQRALDGLAALGDRPRRLMFSGEESLTGSERRVVALAVEGRTNRDIAQELFVTPKTVENHLGRVYVKLGITSRRQLAGALG